MSLDEEQARLGQILWRVLTKLDTDDVVYLIEFLSKDLGERLLDAEEVSQ